MEVFIGTVQVFAFDYAPQGWAICNGASLTVAQNSALFSLLGTRFGGDGVRNFNLPNLGGRTVVGSGQSTGTSNYGFAQTGGAENVSLNTGNLPAHSHSLMALSSTSTSNAPSGNVLAAPTGSDVNLASVNVTVFAPAPSDATGMVALAPSSIGSIGSGSAFSLLQPSTALNYCIAIQGVWPSRP